MYNDLVGKGGPENDKAILKKDVVHKTLLCMYLVIIETNVRT